MTRETSAWRRAAALALALAVLAFPARAAESDDRAKDLKAVHDDVMRQIREKQKAYEREQEKLKKTRKEAVDLGKKERQLLKKLERADRALARTRAELALLDEQIRGVQKDIGVTQQHLAWENVTLDHRRRLLRARLRSLSLFAAPDDWLGGLIAHADLAVPARTARDLAGFVGRDRVIVTQVLARKETLSQTQSKLEEQEQRLTGIQKQKTLLSGRQEKERLERQKIFEEVRGRRGALDELARQIEEEAANMNLLLAALRDQAGKIEEKLAYLRKAFEEKKGLLRWPVARDSIRSVLAYGKVFDESIKEWRINKGIDIWTRSNQSVLSVSPGAVVFSDFFGRMGNMVVIAHGGDYFTLYSHLADIGVRLGESVEDGAAIGRAGNTGRLGEDAVLHFEVRRGGEAVDPESWLGRR